MVLLEIGLIQRHGVVFSQGGVLTIARYAHDRSVAIVRKSKDVTHGVGVSEQSPRQVLIQNHDFGRPDTVRIRESAALQNGNPHDPEVIRPDGVGVVLDAHGAAARVRPEPAAGPVECQEWVQGHSGRRRGRLNSRQRTQAFQRGIHQGGESLRRIGSPHGLEDSGHRMAGVETRVERGGVHQVAEEQQPRAEQQDGYRQLPDHQRVAQRIARRSGLPAALFERAADSRARALQCGHKPGGQRHHEGERHRVGQQHAVRLNQQLDGQRRGDVNTAQQPGEPKVEQQAGARSEQAPATGSPPATAEPAGPGCRRATCGWRTRANG